MNALLVVFVIFALVGFSTAAGFALFAYWPMILGLVAGVMLFRWITQFE